MSVRTKANTTLLPLTRRRFLQLLTASGILLGADVWPKGVTATGGLMPGIQLYTVRELMQQDVPATLQLLAALGYRQVEFAGFFKHSASTLATWLQRYGLTAPAGHVLLEPLLADTTKVLDDAETLGQRYIVLPYLHEHEREHGLSSYQQLAQQLNRVGELCRARGMQLAYHNHDFEFVPMQNHIPYQVLLTETDPTLVSMEIDLYWAAKMQVDVPALFTQYPGRFPLWHVKDMAEDGDFADLGMGVINFSAIIAQAELAGLKHAFVERDHSTDLPHTLRQGIQGFTQLFASA